MGCSATSSRRAARTARGAGRATPARRAPGRRGGGPPRRAPAPAAPAAGPAAAPRGAATPSAAVPRRPVERGRVAAAWVVVTTAGGAAVTVAHGVHVHLLDISNNSNDTSLL